jgi:hypothetical protein
MTDGFYKRGHVPTSPVVPKPREVRLVDSTEWPYLH